jgi:hypothetical protein
MFQVTGFLIALAGALAVAVVLQLVFCEFNTWVCKRYATRLTRIETLLASLVAAFALT